MKNPSTAFSRANRSCSDHGALTRVALVLPRVAFAERGVQRRDELGAVTPEGIAGTGVDQRFEDALVAETQVDPVAQVDEGVVRPARRPAGQDGLDRAGADVLDRAQTE